MLKNKALNGWNLFWLISAPISLAIILRMTQVDLASASGVSSMIQLSVRCAVPWLFLAFAASSLQVVLPGTFSRWLLRNRKFIGLCFAAAMGWQLTFILWLVGVHTDYYVNDVYVLSDVVEGTVGYSFLIAMTFTSFKFGRSLLNAKQWKLLHKSGIYWLWFYAWSVYWFNLFYYESPAIFLDYLYYWGGLLAWGLRLWAWARKKSGTDKTRNALLLAPAAGLLLVGLIGSSMGRAWSPQVYDYLFGFGMVESLDSFMPYFPLVPFYPLAIMMLGTLLIVRSKA
jgi:hypothetical protein